MSSFYMTVRHKASGKLYEALALDDYFGRREYGYELPHLIPMTEAEFFSHYERVPTPPQEAKDE